MLLTSMLTAICFLRVAAAFNETTIHENTKLNCPTFPTFDNGHVNITENGYEIVAHLICDDEYDLNGHSHVHCVDGNWELFSNPQCNKRCYPPPFVQNGGLEIDSDKEVRGMFMKGAVATYSCGEGYYLSPPDSQYRICEKGFWTGPYASCLPIIKVTSCPTPKEIVNGYFVHEKTGDFDPYFVGQRLHYSCKAELILVGSSVQQCLEDGTWSPKIPPICIKQYTEPTIETYPCLPSPVVPHSYLLIHEGYQNANSAEAGTVVEVKCIDKYRNLRNSCKPTKLRCSGGQWMGVLPTCVPAHECGAPPAVPFATVYNVNPDAYETTLTNKYPINSQISYQCLPGYELQGNEILTCSPNACWMPDDPPICYRTSNNYSYYLPLNNLNAILISAATGAGVLGLLLVVCLIIVCRRRKPISRAVTISPPVQRTDLGDHATLLHHPDRLALIAFADGMQHDQSALPTYEEATRERAPGLTANRLHRPHWPNLGGRRARNTPNPDLVHVTRHGSFVSHTPSTRSVADSIGSADTMAVSEGSTNITLDTASSHSGSQPASCRVHCGSLASFDTSSVVNTEGVPLLEESELEEIQGGDNISLIVENHSIADNASFKLSNASAELP